MGLGEGLEYKGCQPENKQGVNVSQSMGLGEGLEHKGCQPENKQGVNVSLCYDLP